MIEVKNRFLRCLKARNGYPMIVAHRGDSFHAPENTLEAGRLAWQAGADAWELDVQLTRDGVPIILHDESLLRTTDVAVRFAGDPRAAGGFRVSEFDCSEVRTLDAGSWFVAADGGPQSARAFGTLEQLTPESLALYRSGRVTIPTLAEALCLTTELDWLVNVEIKSFPQSPLGLLARVLEVINQTGVASRLLISSFDHTDVATAISPTGEFAVGVLTMTPLYRAHEYTAKLLGAHTVHVSAEVLGSGSIAYRRQPAGESLRAELIRELKDHGIPVLVYTVNAHGDGSLAEHLAEMGVDGLFTDDPGGVKRSFERVLALAHGGPR